MSKTTVDLSAIGISAEVQAKAPVQDIKSRTWSSQVAKCVIKEAAVFKTASGATMFKLSIENENGDKYEEYANEYCIFLLAQRQVMMIYNTPLHFLFRGDKP